MFLQICYMSAFGKNFLYLAQERRFPVSHLILVFEEGIGTNAGE